MKLLNFLLLKEIIKTRLNTILFLFFVIINAQAQNIPTGVTFQSNTLMRESRRGDNWCTTWGADGNQYTSLCDGLGWDYSRTKSTHTEALQISGDFKTIDGHTLSGYPIDFRVLDAEDHYMGYFFGYGIVSVNGTIYQFLSRQKNNNFSCPFQGVNIINTPDNGNTWYRHDGANISNTALDYSSSTQFFWQEQGTLVEGKTSYAFSWISVCQMGQDNSKGEKDGYVYLYSPNCKVHELNLARVPESSINDKSTYKYYTSSNADGSANWSSNISERGIVHSFPQINSSGEKFSWYSWLPSVVWNEKLGLYIMVNGGTYYTTDYWVTGKNLHTLSGSLSFYYSKKPWGPWFQFYNNDHWQTGEDPNERIYEPKLSPKWISSNGKEMVLIWSDASYLWSKYYKWNQMKINIEIDGYNQ